MGAWSTRGLNSLRSRLLRRLAHNPRATSGARGQALVEAALVIPLLLTLAFGVVGVGRVVGAEMALISVAREAARAAVLAEASGEALSRGASRGQEVAAGYGLNNGSFALTIDVGSFARGGQVRAVARYQVTLGDLPLLGWVSVPLRSQNIERVDLYRSRWGTGGGG